MRLVRTHRPTRALVGHDFENSSTRRPLEEPRWIVWPARLYAGWCVRTGRREPLSDMTSENPSKPAGAYTPAGVNPRLHNESI